MVRIATGQLTMTELSTLVSDGTFARLLSMLFLFFFMIGVAGVAGYEVITSQVIHPYVLAMLGAGLSTSLTLLGVHLGKTASLPI